MNGALSELLGGAGLLLLTIWITASVSERAANLYLKILRSPVTFLKWVFKFGPWLVDKGKRLKTPLDARVAAPVPSRPTRPLKPYERRIGAQTPEEIAADEAYVENRAAVRRILDSPEQAKKNMEALSKSLKSTQLSEVAKSMRPPLPATWKIIPNWDNIGLLTIENVGPGDAAHVRIASSVNVAVVRKGYWAEFPKETTQSFEVDPGDWVTSEDFYLVLTWQDEEGMDQNQGLDIPCPPE